MAAVLLAAACGDSGVGPRNWDVAVDTVTLYTVDRAEYQGLPAAYDVIANQTQRVEDRGATGSWDFVVTGGVGGSAVALTPLGAFIDIDTQAGIAIVPPEPFDSLAIAPRDSAAYVVDRDVPVSVDSLYVVRSREVLAGGAGCIRFAKLQPLAVDDSAGTLTFMVSSDPVCNDRRLVPPGD